MRLPCQRAVAASLRIAARQQHAHARSAPGLAVDQYPSAESRHVLRALVDADAHARWLRRLEWLEQPLADELGLMPTRVRDLDHRESAVAVQLAP